MATSPCGLMDLLEWKTATERTYREMKKVKQAEQMRMGDGGWVKKQCLCFRNLGKVRIEKLEKLEIE